LASCEGLSDGVPIKPFTPYFVMKIGAVGILPYRKPGDPAIASDILAKPGYSTYLLANHGLIVCGKTLADAVQAAEEFEETAKLWYLGTSLPIRCLSDAEIAELRS
jgi:ribulose-5-phosphate 4-epimerase/fuculose-1-phosphate aldolase